MTQSTPTMPAGPPGPDGYANWPSAQGGYGLNKGWTWGTAQTLAPVPPADRLSLLQTFFSPRGRIGRQSFWLATLGVFTFFYGGMLSAASISAEQVRGPLLAFVYLISLYVSSMVLAKRWHDRSYSGWMALVHFIPLIGPIWTLIECCTEGTRGANRYGVDTNPTPFG